MRYVTRVVSCTNAWRTPVTKINQENQAGRAKGRCRGVQGRVCGEGLGPSPMILGFKRKA
eukprot:4935859-Alexandrium_andersonii.AAC.1